MQFSRYISDCFISHQISKSLFKSLITGKVQFMLTALPCWSGWHDYFLKSTFLLFITSVSISKAFRLIFFLIRQPPTFPHRHQCSIIGRLGLNHRVRDGNGCFPQAHRHRNIFVFKEVLLLELASSLRAENGVRTKAHFVSPSTRQPRTLIIKQ